MNSNSCTTHLATFQITFLISNYLVWEQKCQIEALKLQLTETIVILSWCRKHLTGQAIYNSSLFVTLTWKKSLIGPAAYLMKNMRIQNEFLYCLRSSQTTLMLSCSQLPQKILTILNWGKYLDRVRYLFSRKTVRNFLEKVDIKYVRENPISTIPALHVFHVVFNISLASELEWNNIQIQTSERREESDIEVPYWNWMTKQSTRSTTKWKLPSCYRKLCGSN